MTVKEVIKQLESLGNEARRAHNTKNGAGDNQFSVRLGAEGPDLPALLDRIESEMGNAEAEVQWSYFWGNGWGMAAPSLRGSEAP